MRQKQPLLRKRSCKKSVLRLPDLEHAKAAVLNSLTSADAKRGYRHAIDEFVDWYCSEPRLALNRIVVLRYRSHLEYRQLAPGTINLRLGAVRRLAYEAADCGLLSADMAAGIRRVTSSTHKRVAMRARLGRVLGRWDDGKGGLAHREGILQKYWSGEVGAARSATDLCSALPRIGRRVGADPISLGARFGANYRTLPWLQAANSISRQ